ncbi:MAG: helix-hairpin-helix domain-containing protein [Prevotella sp.]|nr:helix-hairpin-helix domain-containing protein [Prevotella sp.]
MRTFYLLVALVLGMGASAQEARPWERYVNEVMTQEDAESEAWEDTYELLSELEQHPLDINVATREQLEELPFLSARQVEELVEYLDRYGPMKSLGELLIIQSLGYAQRRLLTYFIYVGEERSEGFPRVRDIAGYGHHELIGTGRIPFYERKGDKDGYLGDPYRHWLRYQFVYGDAVKLGLVGAQDAGEPFFTHRNRWGYDYYSLYLQVRNWGRLESLCLGNYRVSMGMGLVMNSEFSLGKVAMLQNMGRSANSLRTHSSRSNNNLRGLAATVDLGRGLKMTAFASCQAMDATLNKDSTAATILTTSYHRTETEMAKKNNLHALKTGGSLRYDRHGLRWGVNALYVRLDRELRPNTSVLYRQHYPQGREFLNASLDYAIVRPRLALSGETAVDKSGHLATINSVSVRLGDGLSIMALQRFYSYAYSSLDARSYSDGGRVQNESGVYLGLSWQPSPSFRLAAYTDYAYFAWARYQVSQSSYSGDHLLQASWQHRHWNFFGRYRFRWRQRDNADKSGLENRFEHRGRLSAEYTGDGGFGSRTQLDGGYCAYGEGEWGAMVSESLSYTYRWLRLNAGIGYFHTDSYDSRVYLYERGPLYTYSISSFYGEGIRYWLMARVNIGQRLMLTAKVGVTDYFDRTTIGSGYQQVDASSLTDMDVQVRWKF